MKNEYENKIKEIKIKYNNNINVLRNKYKMKNNKNEFIYINPLTSPGEGVTVFTSPYLSAGAPALGEAKGLIK